MKPQPPAFHEHMKLVLPSEDSQKPDAEAPQAEDAPIEVVGTWTDETHTSCTWIVKADSFWKYTLKEYNYKPKRFECEIFQVGTMFAILMKKEIM